MILLGSSLAVLLAAAAGALLTGAHPRRATRLGAGGAVVGCGLGIAPALWTLGGVDSASLALPWSVPGGALSLGIDPLSAFFLVPIFAIGSAAAIYGAAYLRSEGEPGSPGASWFWFNLLLASMALVVTARNGLLFLMAWEGMALSSFFLVIFDHERPEVPRAGWVYLVATHLGTAFLLALFALLAREGGSLEFDRWSRPEGGAAGLLALALVGFGSKAGLFPFHVWLPEAHPVAPSHVSAVLSGVMVKLGIYGMLRDARPPGPGRSRLGDPAAGPRTGVRRLRRAGGADPARHQARTGLQHRGARGDRRDRDLGLCSALPGGRPLATLAFAGSLLHVWNHALFKSLLFLASGTLARGAGSLDIECLGGLLRRMPWTGLGLVAGGAAACALPPLNGFAGEFLIYLSSFRGLALGVGGSPSALAAIAGLALVGGLAAAGFVRLLGISLLGEPRSEAARAAREAAVAPARGVLLALSSGCLLLGVFGWGALTAVAGPVMQLPGGGSSTPSELAEAGDLLWRVGATSAAAAVAGATFFALRRIALARPAPERVGTWDCGFAAPGPRMQYTASSFAEPLTRLFAPVLRLTESERKPSGVFPAPASFATRAADLAGALYAALFARFADLAAILRRPETGNTQLYVLYTVVAALVLLTWGLL